MSGLHTLLYLKWTVCVCPGVDRNKRLFDIFYPTFGDWVRRGIANIQYRLDLNFISCQLNLVISFGQTISTDVYILGNNLTQRMMMDRSIYRLTLLFYSVQTSFFPPLQKIFINVSCLRACTATNCSLPRPQ